MAEITYSLKDLVSLAANAENMPLSERLARQYITDGLISAPRAKGGGMAYGPEHVLQLRLVMRLAAQYVQARDIQKFVGRLPLEGLHALVDRPLPPRSPSEGDANAYLTRLSRTLPPALITQTLFRDSILPAARSAAVTPRPRGIIPSESSVPEAEARKPRVERSSWLRATVDTDVEVHVRVQPGANSKRLVDALVAAIQDVLATERGADL
jgi:DNA-binding transcriptional MerR regulator